MSDTKNTDLATVTPNASIVADIRLDKNDLLTVVVSRAEQKMQANVQSALDRVKGLEKQHAAADKEFKNLVGAVGPAHFKDAIAKFNDAITTAGGKPHVTASSGLQNDRKSVQVTLQVQANGGGYNNSMTFQANVAVSPEITAKIEEMDKLADDLRAAREEVVTWRRKLANLPSLERQYKAKLVEGQLSKTAEGQDLLASLDLANFEEAVKALPGV